MRDAPSSTAAGVAVARASLERRSTPTGDPQAEQRLVAALMRGVAEEHVAARRNLGDFFDYLRVRTRFVDDAVVEAVDAGVHQIVILGAGYDARGLRFRSPGVRFFEVDHPATQADKRRLLDEIGAPVDGITFVATDFRHARWERPLTASGFDEAARALFVCEGLLRYLPGHAFRALLRVTAGLGARGGLLAATISTRDPSLGPPDQDVEERERLLERIREPVLTVPTRDRAVRWLSEAGWRDATITDVAELAPVARRGRLLVRARTR